MPAASGGGGFTRPLQQGVDSNNAFGDGGGGNRFQVLSEVAARATGEKDDDDMADEPSPVVEKVPGFGTLQGSNTIPPAQQVPVAPAAPTPPPEPASAAAAPPSQLTPALPAFGSLQQKSILQPESTKPAPPTQLQPLQSAPPPPTQTTPIRTTTSKKELVIDEMAAWMADRFKIGQIPETEPPLQVC